MPSLLGEGGKEQAGANSQQLNFKKWPFKWMITLILNIISILQRRKVETQTLCW